MAAAKKAAAKKTAPDGTEMVPWSERLAKYAEAAAATEANVGSGLQSFSLKAGVLSFDEKPMVGNRMACVVLDHILDYTYYTDDYDPDVKTPPAAYALGRDEETLRWSNDSLPELAGQLVTETEVCQWGSAEKGRGKAAREMRRMLLIPAGELTKQGEFKFITKPDHYENADMAFLKIPPTSVTNWATYVKQLKGTLGRPPFAVVTMITVVPDAKHQFKVQFEALEEIPDDLLDVLEKRHLQAESVIAQPYNLTRDEPEPRGRNAKPAKKPARTPMKKAVAKNHPSIAKKAPARVGRKY